MTSFARTRGVAERIARLGTETAFAVSAEANEWRDQGHKVYPFHLGDMDLPTPQNIVDAAEKAIRDGKTGYCPNAGIMPLREALAADVGASHRPRAGPAERGHRTRRQAGHRQVHPGADEPGRRSALPEPGLPDLREPDRVPWGHRQALQLRRRRRQLRARLRPARSAITPRTRLLDLQQPAEPDRRRKLARRSWSAWPSWPSRTTSSC